MRHLYLAPALAFAAAATGGALAAPRAARPLRLKSPAAGEKWAAGSLHHLTWRSAPEVAAVRIDYSLDGGKTWAPVLDVEGKPAVGAPSAPETANRFLWRVPAKPSARCRVRISSVGVPAMNGETPLAITASQEAPGYEWACITNKADFAGRDGAGALAFQGKMWLLGGWNPGDKVHFPKICNSEVWSSTDGAAWKLEVLQAPWEGRHTAGYVIHNGRMWIVGGDCIGKHYQNDVWSSADGIHWEQATDNVPWGPRVLHHTVAFGGKIWVMGGQTLPAFAPAELVYYNDVWCSADGANWTRVLEHAPWTVRGMVGHSAVFKNRIWLLGGGTYDTPEKPDRTFFSDVWSTADGVKWERHVESAPWHPRQYHDVAVWDGRLWVMEGWNQANRNDVWYSSDGVSWYELPSTPWAPRHAASPFVYNDALWMVAGNNMFPDVWKLVRKP